MPHRYLTFSYSSICLLIYMFMVNLGRSNGADVGKPKFFSLMVVVTDFSNNIRCYCRIDVNIYGR